MKRAAVAGVRRGPPALGRQRRTLRLMQILLVMLAVVLLVFAGYSWGRAAGFDDAGSGDVVRARRPSAGQIAALVILGTGAFGGAIAMQARGGLRMPVPARLDELAGRAEEAAVAEAERAAQKD